MTNQRKDAVQKQPDISVGMNLKGIKKVQTLCYYCWRGGRANR